MDSVTHFLSKNVYFYNMYILQFFGSDNHNGIQNDLYLLTYSLKVTSLFIFKICGTSLN